MSIHFEFIEETEVEHGRYFHVYMLVDFIHQDAKYAISVCSGIQLGKRNDLRELPAVYENELLKLWEKGIHKLREKNQKFIFVIDITNFPYICCGFDLRDPDDDDSPENDDQFGKNLKKNWKEYDLSKDVFTIVVNLHLPLTELKLIPFA